MGLFTRNNKAALAVSPAAPAKAAAAGGYFPNAQGLNMIGQYYTYYEGEARNRAMSVPAVSRSRDLIASVISALPLCMYRETWDDTNREMVEEDLAPRSWLRRPDPSVTYPFIMAWTFDDLFHYGRAFWYITSRTQDGFPASFTRLPAANITTQDQTGPVWFAPSNEIYFQGGMLDPKDVVQFLSPIQGIVYMSEQTITTALKIEQARARNASSPIPSGVLKQTGGEPLSATELADLAASFASARETSSVAALNEFLSYEATNMTPDKMLLIESANYSALDISRLCNIPPYLNGVSTGAYSYQSSQQARYDLWIFGASAYANAIAATLSSDQVLPRGTYVKFDTDDWLSENIAADDPSAATEDMPQENTQERLAE